MKDIKTENTWLMQGDGLSCNKNISKTRSYWNAKYQTCFLVVDLE